jgi:hypothetical protein
MTEGHFELLGEGGHLMEGVSSKLGHDNSVVRTWVGQSGYRNVAIPNCFNLYVLEMLQIEILS